MKTIQYVPQTIDNSSNSRLTCLQKQRKVLKSKPKISYDALSSSSDKCSQLSQQNVLRWNKVASPINSYLCNIKLQYRKSLSINRNFSIFSLSFTSISHGLIELRLYPW